MSIDTKAQQFHEMEAMVRENLKYEFDRNDAIMKETKKLEEICALAISACRDASPLLGDVLLAKAEAIFGKKL